MNSTVVLLTYKLSIAYSRILIWYILLVHKIVQVYYVYNCSGSK